MARELYLNKAVVFKCSGKKMYKEAGGGRGGKDKNEIKSDL